MRGQQIGFQSWAVAAAVFLGLLAGLNRGVFGYLAAGRGSFGPEPFAHFAGDVLFPLALAAGFLLGARSFGARLLAPILEGVERPAWFPILELALGASCASFAAFFLGVTGFFRAGLLRIITVALCALGLADLLGRRKTPREKPSAGPRDPAGGAAVAAGALAYLAWNSVVRALAPPTDADVLKYHLALPKLYLAGGRVDDIPWQAFSHSPQLMGMLYSFGLAFGKEGMAALLHTALCGALVLLTFLLAREEFGSWAAAAAACLLAAQPITANQAGLALSDGALSLFYLLSCACLRRWRVRGEPRWLGPAGMMAGAAASVKLHGAILLVGLAGWLWIRLLRTGAPGGAKAARTFCAWAAVFSAPWYMKAWVRTGNPVWPYLSGLFGGRWGAASVAAWIAPGSIIRPQGAARWLLFGEGAAFLLAPAALASVWAASRGRRPPAVFLLFFAPLPLYILPAAGSISVWRYMLPFYAPLALCAGWALSSLRSESWPGKTAAAGLLAAGLSGALRANHNNELFPVLGLRSQLRPGLSPRQAYLSRALPGYDFIRAVNGRLSAGDRVLLVGDNRGYYLDVDYMLGDPPEQGVIDFDSSSGPEELRRRLARWGITYLAISYEDDWYAGPLRRLATRTYALIDETAGLFGTVALDMNGRKLYALKPFSSEAPPARR